MPLRPARQRIGASLVLGVLLALAAGACDAPQEAIEVAGGAIVVRNLSDTDWRDVRIWVNDRYFGGAREVPAGGFLREPVTRFVTSYGQRLTVNAHIRSVVVLATDEAGERVRIAWGTPQWH
jgi:hypothetical protein